MAVRIESQAEPIPGYRLIERLGGGGFGEVWKAEAPGGLFKAIKFVYGDLGAENDDDDSRADQEFKALNRVKSVHHPFILSLERIDVIESQLIIVMELADRTIWDRFRECRHQGLPGIPREELLGYMMETAEALDLMNSQYQLQHLDIKPQNLFLVFNHIKVADFGLVKDLEGRHATVTGGVTPVYAAPETFDGWISRFSDQYSLAIVYQELLTGQRPFSGTTIRQLVMQHLQRPPDLTSVLPAERPPLGRALSKNPEHRFPTCNEFVEALRAAVAKHGNVVPVLPGVPAPKADSASASSGIAVAGEPTPPPSSEHEFPTENARGRFSRSMTPDKSEPAPPPVSVLPQRPPKEGSSAKAKPAQATGTDSERTPVPNTTGNTSVPPISTGGILRPALVVGLGRIGLGALKQLRNQVNEQFGQAESFCPLSLLFIDTDPESVQLASQGGNEGLHPSEVVLARLQRPAHYLKNRDCEAWLDQRVLYRIPRSRNYAGVRPLGRLAFVDNFRVITQRLDMALTAIVNPELLREASEKTGLQPRSMLPRVYIVTSLTGGTGSGMFLDLAYLVRRWLRLHRQERAELCGVFFVPANGESSQTVPLANTQAAFTELAYFSARDTTFSFRYEQGKPPEKETAPPFENCYILPLPEPRNGAAGVQSEATSVQAGNLLFHELLTPMGPALDDARRQADTAASFGDLVGYHTFASYRVFWPRRRILAQAAHKLCSRLVQHWMSKDASGIQEEIRIWAVEQWDAQGFRPEDLLTRCQEECARILEQAPEQACQAIINPAAAALSEALPPGSVVKIAPAIHATDGLEKLLGVPDECRAQEPGESPEASPVEKAIQETVRAMAPHYEDKLAELIVRLFEEPAFRLAGAEELIRQLGACAQKALESQEPLCRELEERTLAIYGRLHLLLDGGTPVTPQTTPRWKTAFSRRPANAHPGSELLELIRAYAKCRYQSLVMQYINGLYVRLRGFLSDQMREIGYCRTRLSELAGLIRTRLSAADPACRADEILLPPDCNNVEAVAKQVDAGIGGEDLLAFDQQAQSALVKQYQGLVTVCLANSASIAALLPELVRTAEEFIGPRWTSDDVAGLYLSRYPEGEEGVARLKEDLRTAFEAAAPSLTSVPSEREVCIIAVPPGEAGDRLRQLARSAIPRARIVTGISNDELVILRGCQRFDPAETEQLGDKGQEAYRARQAQEPFVLHSRTDIESWRSEAAAVS